MIHFENVLNRYLQDVWKTSSKLLEDFLKMSWRRLENVLKTPWRYLEDVFTRRLEGVLKTHDQDDYIDLDQDVLKTSWRCLLKTKTKDVFKTSSSRRMFAGLVVTARYLVVPGRYLLATDGYCTLPLVTAGSHYEYKTHARL